MKSIVISPEPGTKPGAKDVCDTPNDRDTRAIVRAMNGWPFMPRSLAQNRKPFCALIARNDGAQGAMVRHMNGWPFMRLRLPQNPGPHCEPQSQSLSRPWVKKRPMKTCVTPGNVSPKAQSGCALRTPLEGAGRGKKRAGMGMTPTPPQAGGEAACSRARRLLDQTRQRESCAVRRCAVALLHAEPQAERQPGGRKGEMKFDEQPSGL